MSVIGGAIFLLLATIMPKIRKTPITIWEIYFVGVLIPYSVGAFLVFSFGDWVCLKLKLYKDNEVFGLGASTSLSSPHINEARNTTFGTGTSESEHLRTMMST